MRRWHDKKDFKARVLEWADKLDVRTRSVTMRSMRSKWASCSTAGNLTFNSELLDLDREVGDYVIVHELLHFSVPNHGKLWKSLMHAHLGDYLRLETGLPLRATSVREAVIGAKTVIRRPKRAHSRIRGESSARK